MCGIAGILTTNSLRSSTSVISDVRYMTDKLAHRGPDGEGLTQALPTGTGGCVVLGHRRLSIVDIAGGAQPMSCPTDRYWITFNGEIYNFPKLRLQLIELDYEFKTNSDTEVVLTAFRHYGTDCFEMFNGMFSLAIWDSLKQKLYVARDAYGKKPFFYFHDASGIQFASEIKAFLNGTIDKNKTLNKEVLKDCSMLRYVPGEKTLVNQVLKIEPGTYAIYDPESNSLNKFRFYHYPDSKRLHKNSNDSKDVGRIQKDFLSLLDDSVASRMNCDVPFGAFLSGGIDSAVVVALMSKHISTPVKTFSIGFEQKKYSELESAKMVADNYGTEHYERIIKAEDIIEFLPEAIYYRDGPVSEPSDVPILLLSRMASEKVKMVLTGEGSDEILGGYPKHVYEKYADYSEHLPIRFRRFLRASIRARIPAKHEKIKTALSSLLSDSNSDRMQRWFGSTDIEISDSLYIPLKHVKNEKQDGSRFEYEGESALRNILLFDQSVWLPNNLLERGDRMTMASGLEARMPFLDTRIAQFVSDLPDRFRVRGKTTKWILRQAAANIIPNEIIQRKKIGFKVPIEEWFRTNLSDYLHELIVTSDSRLHEHVNVNVVRRLFEEHVSERQNHEKILWSLLNMEIWLRQMDGEFTHHIPNNTAFIDQASGAS